jgi:hypothetical protein
MLNVDLKFLQVGLNVNMLKTLHTNPHWAREMGYCPFSLCVIHKKGLCPSSGEINKLMMLMLKDILNKYFIKINI